jgi:hypothetical protein
MADEVKLYETKGVKGLWISHESMSIGAYINKETKGMEITFDHPASNYRGADFAIAVDKEGAFIQVPVDGQLRIVSLSEMVKLFLSIKDSLKPIPKPTSDDTILE